MKKFLIKNKKELIIITIFSFILMFLFSKNSPFYLFNQWGDVNAYFTMGKGMMNGKVIFKDLFEQKGPLIYVIYGIAYLISNTSFLGAYILESIFMTITLFFTYKIARLYFKPNIALLVPLLLPIIILNKKIFVYGGSAEEFTLAFEVISMYLFLKYFKNKEAKEHNPKNMLIQGILIGSIILTKFNLAILEIAFVGFIFLNLLIKKEYKNFFKNLAYFFIGLGIIFIPFLIYFILTKSVDDFLFAYFKFNGMYGGISKNAPKLLMNALKEVYKRNTFPCYVITVGLIYLLRKKKNLSTYGKTAFITAFAAQLIMTYISGRSYMYMFLPISIFSIFGIISLLDASIYFTNKKDIPTYLPIIISVLVVPIIIFGGTYINESRLFVKETSEIKIANIIKKDRDRTVLNYGALDFGIYTATGTVPNVKYFHRLNIDYSLYPELMNKQKEYIKNKEAKYVVLKLRNYYNDSYRPDVPYLNEYYELINTYKENLSNKKNTFFLYKLRSIN